MKFWNTKLYRDIIETIEGNQTQKFLSRHGSTPWMHSRQSEVVARQENTLLSVQCKQTDASTCNKKLLRCGEERLGFDLRDLPVLSGNNHIIDDMKFETMWDRRSSFLSFTVTKKKTKRKRTDRWRKPSLALLKRHGDMPKTHSW